MRSYTRHQLKQDQFTATAKETMSWAVEHRKKLTTGGIIVAVVAALVLGGWSFIRYQETSANAALSTAMTTYSAPLLPPGTPATPGVVAFASSQDRAKAARPQFLKVASDHGITRSGVIAHYFVGLTDIDLGDYKDAESQLQQVAGSRHQDLAALAKFALANVYRQTNRDAQAIQLYKDLIDHPATTVPKASAQLELAALYAPKQPADARKIYEDIRKENPQGPAATVAASRLEELK